MSSRKTRDVDADYRTAMIAEWKAYDGSGRTREADHVAKTLREQYGYDVDAQKAKKADGDDGKETRQQGPPETTARESAPEAAVEPKPEPAGSRSPSRPRTPPAKKATPAKPDTKPDAKSDDKS
jgi:hypothetical protein